MAARGLMAKLRLLLRDVPLPDLAPAIVPAVFRIIADMQDASRPASGRNPAALRHHEAIKAAYAGGHTKVIV